MLAGSEPVAQVETIEQAVKVTAGIVDSFAKGWHPSEIFSNDDGNIVIKAEKEESE